jgi:hypothetical protein
MDLFDGKSLQGWHVSVKTGHGGGLPQDYSGTFVR